jgi:hypothetical protein
MSDFKFLAKEAYNEEKSLFKTSIWITNQEGNTPSIDTSTVRLADKSKAPTTKKGQANTA